MSHATHAGAALTPRARLRLVALVVDRGWPIARAAERFDVSWKTAAKWARRYAVEGSAGMLDRSCRPHSCPRRTPPAVEAKVVAARREYRRGQDWIAAHVGVPARTVNRVLRRHGLALLRMLDPLTGQPIRAPKTTTTRYERERPGELVHVDVKKLGKIPDGGGWRAHGRPDTSVAKRRRAKVGYDDVHSMVDDHSRLAYCEILPDERRHRPAPTS